MKHASHLARILLVLVVAAGTVFAIRYVWQGSFQPAEIKAAIGASPLAPLVFVAVTAAASLVFVPRTVLAVAAGLVFGLWWGLLWTMLGSAISAVLGFLLARYINNGLVDAATLPRLAPVLRAAEQGGWRIVALIRLLPLPHAAVNYALGLTRLKLGAYSVGSVLGMLPMTVPYVQLGVSGGSALSGHRWVMPLAVAVALLGLSALLPRLAIVRRSLRLGEN